MKNTTKRIFSGLILLCVVATILFSAVFILGHADHDCIGDKCFVCVQIHDCQRTLERLLSGAGSAVLLLFACFLSLCLLLLSAGNQNAGRATLCSQKIRLNI